MNPVKFRHKRSTGVVIENVLICFSEMYFFLNRHGENSGIVGGRSSPEGGRESPRLTDGALEDSNVAEDDRRSVHGSEGDMGALEELPLGHLDENSSKLFLSATF